MRFKLDRDFYRPSSYQVKLVPKGIQAEIYLVDDTHAVGFGGRRSKPDFNMLFRSKEQRDNHIKEYVERQKIYQANSAENKAKRAAKGRGLDLGDILVCSWGYDQTNIDYYEVVELVGKKSVKIVPICSEVVRSSPGADYVKPIPGSRRDWDVLLDLDRGWQEKQPMGVLKRASDGAVNVGGHRAYQCDPNEERYETAAGWGH